ncbi:MAG: OmpA family protein [Erythrobacter sp.]|nr:MAG: OmpA family protein [Erythrobacter sp.]
MRKISNRPLAAILFAAMAVPAWSAGIAQELPDASATSETDINVYGTPPGDLSELTEGPDIEGFISARNGSEVEITATDGTVSTIALAPATEIRARGGFLGLNRTTLAANQLLNGLPVTVETVQWENGLLARRIRLSDNDLETATMIRTGTEQRFGMNEAAIEVNAAATEALRGRVANIDQYNVLASTNAYFDTGRWELSPAARSELCATAAQAEATDNALLLVVGYTDSVGDQEYNQTLSERRAGRVVNHLQQECGWAPWRMLTPTGMAEADPAADNESAAGRAQNRRVSVNILVSKAVEGM